MKRSIYGGIKKHEELLKSITAGTKSTRPGNPEFKTSHQSKHGLNSPKHVKDNAFFSSPVKPLSPKRDSFSPRQGINNSVLSMSPVQLHLNRSRQSEKSTLDVRDKIRYVDALQEAGITIDQETLDLWMSHEDFDGVSFNSLAILYEIKLSELSAHVERVIDKYPNKAKTTLVCSIFDALANAEGRYARLLRSIRPALFDAIYASGIKQVERDYRINFAKDATWYDLTKSLSASVKGMKAQAAVEERSRKMVVVKKRMQKLFVERSLGRVQNSMLRIYFEQWARRVALLRTQREKIVTYIGKQFSRSAIMEKKYRFELWRLVIRYKKENSQQHDSYMDLTDELEAKEKRIVMLRTIIMKLKQKLRDMFKLLRFSMDDLRMEMIDLQEIFDMKAYDLSKLIGQKEEENPKPEMVDNWCQTNNELEKIKLTKEPSPVKVEEKVEAKAQQPVKKVKKKRVYKSKVKLTLAKVLDYIACMYEKKVKADSVDDASGKDRDTLPEFCEDFFTQMFGIKALAGKKKYELEQGVKVHSKTSTRVRWFGSFMGWKVKPHEDMEGFNITYDENAIDVFLYVLQNVLPPDAIEERMDDDPCLIKIDKVTKAINVLFRQHTSNPLFITLVESLKKKAMKPKKGSFLDVEFDYTFDLIMKTWYKISPRPKCPGR